MKTKLSLKGIWITALSVILILGFLTGYFCYGKKDAALSPLRKTQQRDGKQLTFLKNIHPDFVGREKYLKDLETICLKNRDEALPVTVLWGDGGVGKSETAVAFGNLYAENFSLYSLD